MKNIDIHKIKLKYIRICFQHQDQKVTFITENFKRLGEMKEKAIKKMTNLPPEVRCYYMNKDYSKNENKKLGDIFNNREEILIKLISSTPLTSRNIVKSNKILTKYEKINNNFGQKNESVNCRNKINIINPKKLKLYDKYKLPNVKNFNSPQLKPLEKKFDDNLINQIYPNKSSDILPTLNNNDDNTSDKSSSNQISDYDSPLFNLESKMSEISCYECGKNKITHFCRSCNSFLCEKCLLSDKHKFHLIIKLNFDNTIKNIISYGILIQKDICDNLELNKNIREFKNMYDDEILNRQKEEINSKFKLIIKKYNDIMNGIYSNIKKENKEKMKLSLATYNNTAKTIKKEINNLVENYKLNNSKQSFKELREFFKEINDKEETLSYFKKSILRYHLMSEINKQLKSSFDKINKILSEVTDKNNPFHLEEKYFQELIKMKIFKVPKSEEEILKEKQKEQNERDQIIIGGQVVGKSRIEKRRNGITTLNNDD